MSSPALEAVDLSKTIASGERALTILDSIGLSLNTGDSLSIVGTSGSGKSTLLALLAGLDVPTRGTLKLLGRDLTTLDEDARAAWRTGQVGFVFQSFQLLAGLSALDNVTLPLELAGTDLAEARDIAHALLAQVGLADRLRHTPRQLSGGEQQRVALARAFACRPRILFADEPTGNLDGKTGAAVIDQLFALNAEQGTTLVLVTHDEHLAARCASRCRLADGQLHDG
ncbi:ATP-binding cassette domain-containing protein [Endozoicomonas sp. G2_2]|uniref:ABC transporter ATP-binding protein n=1 Tax=Endozoicomonas sp. G2_2 TaxID=2821092 RepID=UPI001ADCF608|nr:ATP-binding cassette domain-containing protein [Endozoicomonas sp. G2_2]MBO9468600.1 ATP-binding cassette domain-containing protein [Endozoicomonas sp. G2_2]